MKTLLPLFLLFASCAAAGGPYERIGLDQKPGGRVDMGLPFRDENGSPIRLGDAAAGRPALLVLSYYRCPMLCAYVLNGLAQGLDRITLQPGKDYRVLAVSIDPREGPELAAAKKRTYLSRVGRDPAAEAGWRFLTGEPASIESLAGAVGFRYAYDSVAKEWAHPAAAIVLTPEGTVSRYLPGVEFAPRDLRLALVESSRGKVGGISDRAYLACYRYDPVTGRYVPYVNTAVRVLGVGLVLGIILAGIGLERRGRRRRARILAERERGADKAVAHG